MDDTISIIHVFVYYDIKIHNIDCYLNDCLCNIIVADNVKYMGIYVDGHLKWNIDVSYVNSKIRKMMYHFKQLRLFIPYKTKIYLYWYWWINIDLWNNNLRLLQFEPAFTDHFTKRGHQN